MNWQMRAPARGDVVWVDFNPQTGREQAGRRPGVVSRLPASIVEAVLENVRTLLSIE